MQGFVSALQNMKDKMKLQIARHEVDKQAEGNGPVTPPILGRQAPITDGMLAQILSRLDELKADMGALQEEVVYLRSSLQLPPAQARQTTLLSVHNRGCWTTMGTIFYLAAILAWTVQQRQHSNLCWKT
jgi:hypothetical protein